MPQMNDQQDSISVQSTIPQPSADQTSSVYGWRRLVTYILTPLMMVGGAWLLKRGGLSDDTARAFFSDVLWMWFGYISGDAAIKVVRAITKK